MGIIFYIKMRKAFNYGLSVAVAHKNMLFSSFVPAFSFSTNRTILNNNSEFIGEKNNKNSLQNPATHDKRTD